MLCPSRVESMQVHIRKYLFVVLFCALFFLNSTLIISEFDPNHVKSKIDPFPQDNEFGISTKLSNIEGAFSVVATDNIGGVYVAYQSYWNENEGDPRSFHIYFVYSHDFGKTWSESFRINDNKSYLVSCDSPSIAVDSKKGFVYITWKDNRTGTAKLYVDRSMDRGVTFGNDISVYDWNVDLVPTWLPYTATIKVNDQGKVFIVWIAYTGDSLTNSSVFFSYSTSDDLTFAKPTIIDPIIGEYRNAHPWIAVQDKNTIFIAYCRRNSTISNVFLAKSVDGGVTFNSGVKINDGTTQHYTGGIKVVIARDGTIHAVWTDGRNGNSAEYMDIYYAQSIDGGVSFKQNLRVNDDTEVLATSPDMLFTKGSQGSAFVAVDSKSNVHIVWEDLRNYVSDTTYCRDIYYASVNGSHITKNIKVNYVNQSVQSVNAADPFLAIDSHDNMFLVYSDSPSGDYDTHSIYFESVIKNDKVSTATSNGFEINLIFVSWSIFIILIFRNKKFLNKK